LLTNEALDVLALRPGATPVEIKEAYRDLVKVWHPDRFGSDPRLRQKAEDKLRQINDAYRVLQSRPDVGGRFGSETEDDVSSGRGEASSTRFSSSRPRKGRTRWNKSVAGVGWVYGFLGIALGCVAGYLLLGRRSMLPASLPPSPQQQAATAGQQTALTTSSAKTPGGVFDKPHVRVGDGSKGDVGRPDADSSNRAAAPFRVFSLSDAQTSQLEAACSSQKEQHGSAAYQACVKAQLDLITHASSPPDLNALSSEERESIESVCAVAKRRHGANGYNLCLNIQMASLAAEPSRPDLTTVNDADRASIESACRNAKYREGPSAYDRCRVRFIKLLVESR
jgi:hypothetical protein